MILERRRIGRLLLLGVFVLGCFAAVTSMDIAHSPSLALLGQTPTAPASINSIIPLPSSRSLSATQLAGKKLFLQRCSICHLPGLPTYKTYAPLLDGKIIAAKGEPEVREYILHGSPRMPGFQYTLEQADIDEIIAYLKILVYDPAAQKYNYSSIKK